MDVFLFVLSGLIALCDWAGMVFQAVAFGLAWPFAKTARACFALADKLTFGTHRP